MSPVRVSTTPNKMIPFYQLASDLTICRIINGMRQVAGGHGHIDHESAIADMSSYSIQLSYTAMNDNVAVAIN
jgi:hypothetical protein